ncbi:hypothetical protein [Candidatus Uabimicrobium amorphum]|uniref:DUF3153 domain-containing protein n=1 Tax=Uabimicrobium amorphum TaxID=2596890 RepID=A0A5S9IMK8_UABAM|nr:hypothetical protein [Candidatus Uabimicrobium amorphum]BBM84310.1 hypothetical protein UABAM_02667 [Candidatus Uabimicrobium amorphum]
MIKKFCLLLASIVLFSGCIEVEQEIWIHADGSGRVRIAFGVSSSMYKMMNFKSDEDRQKEIKENVELLEKNPNVAKAEIKEYEKKDLWFYDVDVHINDLRNTKQLQEDLQKIFSSKGKRKGRDAKIAVEKLDNGNYLFMYKFKLKEEEETQYAKSVNQFFKDKHFLFRLHAPHIVATNGYRNKEQNMAEWRFDMVDVIEQKGEFLPQLRAEIAGPKIWLWITVGILIILAIIGVFFYKRQKKK